MATITIAMASLPIPVFGNGFFLEKPHLPVNGDCVLKYHYFFQECDQGKAVWDFSHAIPKGESHYMQWISYDGMDRLVSVSSSHDGEGMKRLNQTSYDRTGRIESLQLGTSANGRIGYRYDVRGWPTAIISPHFTQELYYSNDSKGNNNPCFNGNISAVWWEGKDAIYAERSTSHHYAFDYDYKNRLVKASYIQTGSKEINGGLIIGNQADYSCEYAYDLNGNITSLTRNGVAMSVQAFDFKCWNFGMIDDAKFEYDGNQLIRAYDDCESLTYAAAMDFKARTAKSNQYSWDANGNMTSDMNRNITKSHTIA